MSQTVATISLEWWRAGKRSESRLRSLVTETLNAYPAADAAESLKLALSGVKAFEFADSDWRL